MVHAEDSDYVGKVEVTFFQNPKIYYENYGPTKLIGGHYKIITYLSLDEYNKHYEGLGDRISNLINTCKNTTHSMVCANYQNVLSHLYQEITSQRDKMYISLGKNLDNKNNTEEYEARRKRRGLINFIGTGLHFLFGICDDDCTAKANDAIEQNEKNGKNVLHIVKQQTTVVKTAVREIATTINKTEKIYNEMQQMEKSFVQNLVLLGNATDDILNILQSNALQNLYTLITNQYAYDTENLIQIVTAARAGVIHSNLLTNEDVARIVRSIRPKLNSHQLEIPLGTTPLEVYDLFKISKMSVYYSNNRIVFITKLPLVKTIEFTTYSVIPVPFRTLVNETRDSYLLETESPYVAITKDRSNYVTFTIEQLDKCVDTHKFRICPHSQPVQQNNQRSPCEVQLFKEEKLLSTRNQGPCNLRSAYIPRGIYHKLRYSNEWIYTVVADDLVITCASISQPKMQTIFSAGIISINDTDCRITTNNELLVPDEELSIKTHSNFIPRTNLSPLLDMLPNVSFTQRIKHLEVPHNIKLTDMKHISKSLDEINDMIDEEEIRQNNYKKIEHHSYLTVILIAISTTLLVVIYVLIKCKYPHHVTSSPSYVSYSGQYEPQQREYFISRQTSVRPVAPPSPR